MIWKNTKTLCQEGNHYSGLSAPVQQAFPCSKVWSNDYTWGHLLWRSGCCRGTTPKLFKAPWKKINKPAGAAASGAAVVAGVAPAKFGTSAEMFSNPGTLFNFASNIKRAVSRREMLQDTEFNLSCWAIQSWQVCANKKQYLTNILAKRFRRFQ